MCLKRTEILFGALKNSVVGAAPEAGEPSTKGNDVAIGHDGNNDWDMENGDDIVVDGRLREVQVAGERLTLTPTEFRLLSMFMREPGRTFTREQIIDQVFGYDFDGFLERMCRM